MKCPAINQSTVIRGRDHLFKHGSSHKEEMRWRQRDDTQFQHMETKRLHEIQISCKEQWCLSVSKSNSGRHFPKGNFRKQGQRLWNHSTSFTHRTAPLLGTSDVDSGFIPLSLWLTRDSLVRKRQQQSARMITCLSRAFSEIKEGQKTFSEPELERHFLSKNWNSAFTKSAEGSCCFPAWPERRVVAQTLSHTHLYSAPGTLAASTADDLSHTAHTRWGEWAYAYLQGRQEWSQVWTLHM